MQQIGVNCNHIDSMRKFITATCAVAESCVPWISAALPSLPGDLLSSRSHCNALKYLSTREGGMILLQEECIFQGISRERSPTCNYEENALGESQPTALNAGRSWKAPDG